MGVPHPLFGPLWQNSRILFAIRTRIGIVSGREDHAARDMRKSALAEAANYLVDKIRKGGVGVWGQVPMPAQSGIKDDELMIVVRWIISGREHAQ